MIMDRLQSANHLLSLATELLNAAKEHVYTFGSHMTYDMDILEGLDNLQILLNFLESEIDEATEEQASYCNVRSD